jgi:hypothetical protein
VGGEVSYIPYRIQGFSEIRRKSFRFENLLDFVCEIGWFYIRLLAGEDVEGNGD